jgi:hypothetical protein
MDGNEAQLKVSVVMGDVEIRVPRGWTVTRRRLGVFLGEMENRTSKISDGENAKTLVITGGVVFGKLLVRD